MATTTQSNKELIERSCDAMNDKDRETFMELQDSEIVHHQGSAVLYGVEAVTKQVWSALEAFPDLTVTPEEILAEGTTTPADFVGPLEGLSFEEASAILEEERAYVNVHTIEYPAGEIRGQIEVVDEMDET